MSGRNDLNRKRHCPIPASGGDCWNESHPDSSLNLCWTHFKEIGEEYNVGHEVQHLRCRACGLLSLRFVPADSIAYCTNRACAKVHFLNMDAVK